jgi:hypothetical protein
MAKTLRRTMRSKTVKRRRVKSRTRKGGKYGAHNPKNLRRMYEKQKRNRTAELKKLSKTGKVKNTVKLLGGRRRR